MEFKARYGKRSPEQVVFEVNCKELGIGYHVCKSLEDFKAAIDAEQERFRRAWLNV